MRQVKACIGDLVDLRLDPCPVDKDPRVRHETGGRASDVLVDLEYLLDGGRLDERARYPLVNDYCIFWRGDL